MILVGCFPYRFVDEFNEKNFRRANLEAASGNAVLQLFALKVDTIVPMW